jgi:simple sugar transport system permease protein
VLAVAAALGIGGILIAVIGQDPVEAFAALLDGALGGVPALAGTVRAASPLILTGLAVTIAFRAGVINLGTEGSLYLGALGAALAGIYAHPLPGLFHLPLALSVGAVVGGLWAFFPGYLRVRMKVDEVVATLMLNYVAILLADFLVLSYFLDPAIGTTSDRPATVPVPGTARLPFLSETYGLTVSVLIGLALVALLAWLYRRSVWGYESDITGVNQRFALFGGVNTSRIALSSMVMSGLLGGLAGATLSLGFFGRYVAGLSTGLGFEGIAVALIGQLNPLGVLLSALFFGALKNGGSAMELAVDVPRDVVLVVQGLILALVTSRRLFGWIRFGLPGLRSR